MATDSLNFAVSCTAKPTGARTLQKERQLGEFLAEVERRALRIAEIGVRDRDEALDLVQDAMIKLVRNYSGRSVLMSGRRFFIAFCRTVYETGIDGKR